MTQCNRSLISGPAAASSRLCKPMLAITILLWSLVLLAARPDDDDSDDELKALHAQIESGRAEQAVAALLDAADSEPNNADIHNLLGFGYRHLGDFELARRHYDRALSLDPDHKDAHEYLGELELQQGNVAAARRHLAALARLCPQGCDELDDLRQALAEHGESSY